MKYSTYVRSESGLKLQSKIDSDEIDCYWQDVGHNMYVRFGAGLYTTNDEYELEVSGVLDQRMTPIKRMQMTRR